tara:strand:+ start:1087 stop:1437 length:351 start_codon:yes stop_codon:yes gene_type:complete
MKTIFCDIDGTLLKHHGGLHPIMSEKPVILPNVIKSLARWSANDYTVILTTGRPESMRPLTIKHLEQVGIFYDQLIMGLSRGPRVLINDTKPNCNVTASAINVERNTGLSEEHILL